MKWDIRHETIESIRQNEHKKMKKALFLIMALILGGCASTAGYEKVLSTWVGADEAELIQRWGEPQTTYVTQGKKQLTYIRTSSTYMRNGGTEPSSISTDIGNPAYHNLGRGKPEYSLIRTCVTTFESENGKIVSWHWEGNNCA